MGRGVEHGHEHHIRALNTIRKEGSIRAAVDSGVLTGGIMHALVTHDKEFVLVGSVRDDGPLPDVYTDVIEGQRAMRAELTDVGFCLMVATMLHSVATGNILPASIPLVCVDINPATVTKLADRGSSQARGIVTDVGLFLEQLAVELVEGYTSRRAVRRSGQVQVIRVSSSSASTGRWSLAAASALGRHAGSPCDRTVTAPRDEQRVDAGAGPVGGNVGQLAPPVVREPGGPQPGPARAVRASRSGPPRAPRSPQPAARRRAPRPPPGAGPASRLRWQDTHPEQRPSTRSCAPRPRGAAPGGWGEDLPCCRGLDPDPVRAEHQVAPAARPPATYRSPSRSASRRQSRPTARGRFGLSLTSSTSGATARTHVVQRLAAAAAEQDVVGHHPEQRHRRWAGRDQVDPSAVPVDDPPAELVLERRRQRGAVDETATLAPLRRRTAASRAVTSVESTKAWMRSTG